jgi:hypothetical protein
MQSEEHNIISHHHISNLYTWNWNDARKECKRGGKELNFLK